MKANFAYQMGLRILVGQLPQRATAACKRLAILYRTLSVSSSFSGAALKPVPAITLPLLTSGGSSVDWLALLCFVGACACTATLTFLGGYAIYQVIEYVDPDNNPVVAAAPNAPALPKLPLLASQPADIFVVSNTTIIVVLALLAVVGAGLLLYKYRHSSMPAQLGMMGPWIPYNSTSSGDINLMCSNWMCLGWLIGMTAIFVGTVVVYRRRFVASATPDIPLPPDAPMVRVKPPVSISQPIDTFWLDETVAGLLVCAAIAVVGYYLLWQRQAALGNTRRLLYSFTTVSVVTLAAPLSEMSNELMLNWALLIVVTGSLISALISAVRLFLSRLRHSGPTSPAMNTGSSFLRLCFLGLAFTETYLTIYGPAPDTRPTQLVPYLRYFIGCMFGKDSARSDAKE
jgi:hypothetical protein